MASASRSPISFDAVTAAARGRRAIEDRLVEEIPLAAIDPSPRNPRRHLARIEELAESIREYGLLQPVVLRHHGARYELMAGHRRFEAIKALGWSRVPAVLRDDVDERLPGDSHRESPARGLDAEGRSRGAGGPGA